MSSPGSSTTSKATRPGQAKGLRDRLGWWWQAPVGVLVVSILVVMLTVITFGATRPNTGNPPSPGSSTSPEPIGLPTALVSAPQLSPAPVLPELTAAIERLEQKYDVLIGLTLSQVAQPLRHDQDTWYGGRLRGGQAFATIDVPMALAVLGDARQPQQRDYLFNKALADDSAAADDALWAFLGSGEQAADKTTRALQSFGDWRTLVPSESQANSEAPYLDTQWALDAQSRLAGAMLCDFVKVHPVLSKMNDPAESAWGLQVQPLSYSKGGWGRAVNGDTLVRQFGIMRLADGTEVGIAMAASYASPDPEIGKGALTELATSVRKTARGIEPAHC